MGHGLVVEDDATVRRALVSVLLGRMPDCVIDTATTREEAMSRLTGGLSWILVDMCLGPWRVGPDRNMDGVAVLLEARARGILAPAVIMTGALDVADALNPEALGVIAVLKKPFPMNELVDILAHAGSGASPPPPPAVDKSLAAFDEDHEQQKLEHVRRVLDHKRWSKRGAAKLLKVDRRTIDRYVERLAECGIHPPARKT